MSSLSLRGRALVDSPPLAPYIAAHFERFDQPWDPALRPDGYIALCIAENKRRAPQMLEILGRFDQPPQHVLGYDAVIGNLDFRRNLAAFMGRRMLGRPIEAESLVVLAGAGSVLEMLFHVLADPGEGVLVPTPSYAGFWADLETRDALVVVPVPSASADGFALDTARFDEMLERAEVPIKALLFTSPDNPLGRVYTAAEIDAVLRWADARGLHVVFDEIYALSVFGERPFVSAASRRPSLGDRVHVVWGFSKDFGASGLRCGVLLSENQEVLQAVGGLAYWSICSGHTQYLLSSLVGDDALVDDTIAQTQADLGRAYASVTAGLRAEGIEYLEAGAAFFLVCDLRPWLETPTFEAERRLWQRLLDEANVNLTPGEACRIAEPGFFRLCYASEPELAVHEAIGRLGRVLRAAEG
ncbi:MAG: aminotransferase class I/II-fold pyridoxal phosphate-dependent enzyme [Nannocystaceae bacterium]